MAKLPNLNLHLKVIELLSYQLLFLKNFENSPIFNSLLEPSDEESSIPAPRRSLSRTS